MRLTSSFAVFRADPQEQDLAKARWLAREGKLEAAELEYRGVLELHPSLATGWIEICELLRRQGRLEDALECANRAALHFGDDAAMPLALKGAALSELGRTREAVAALEAALERDGNLALAWHELAYAAYRVGEYPRALLALDRAFALEPHTDTLMLRGRILREAGQYEAAEVAFMAAHQASDHDIPRRDAEREVLSTKRGASLGGRKPKQFTLRERAYVQTGTVILEPDMVNAEQLPDSLGRSIAAVAPLIRRVGWKPSVVAGASRGDSQLAEALARLLGIHPALAAAVDPQDSPLIVTIFNGHDEEWAKQVERMTRWKSGLTFALAQSPSAEHSADIAGRLGVLDRDLVARAAGRAMERDIAAPDVTEATALLLGPQSPWRLRLPE